MVLVNGRPADCAGRLPKEIRCYDLLDRLGVSYQRIDHEAAMTMEACEEIDRVLDIFQNHDPVGFGADFLQRRLCRAAHGAQTAPGQMVARQLAQHAFIGGVNRDFRATGQGLPGGSVNVLAFHQQRNRLAAAVQRPVDDLGAFGNKHPLCRLETVEQLCLRQPGVNVQLRSG